MNVLAKRRRAAFMLSPTSSLRVYRAPGGKMDLFDVAAGEGRDSNVGGLSYN